MRIQIRIINEKVPKSRIIGIAGDYNEDNPIIDTLKSIGLKDGREFSLKIKQ